MKKSKCKVFSRIDSTVNRSQAMIEEAWVRMNWRQVSRCGPGRGGQDAADARCGDLVADLLRRKTTSSWRNTSNSRSFEREDRHARSSSRSTRRRERVIRRTVTRPVSHSRSAGSDLVKRSTMNWHPFRSGGRRLAASTGRPSPSGPSRPTSSTTSESTMAGSSSGFSGPMYSLRCASSAAEVWGRSDWRPCSGVSERGVFNQRPRGEARWGATRSRRQHRTARKLVGIFSAFALSATPPTPGPVVMNPTSAEFFGAVDRGRERRQQVRPASHG